MRITLPLGLGRTTRKLVRNVRYLWLKERWDKVEPRDGAWTSYPRSRKTSLRHILYFHLTDSDTVDGMTELNQWSLMSDRGDLNARLAAKGDAEHGFVKTHEVALGDVPWMTW